KNGDVTDTKDVVVVIKKQRGALENKVTGAELTSFDALKALVPEAGNSTKEKYLTIGYVEEIKSSTYGNMVISDANGKTLEIYGSYGHDGDKRYDKLDVKPGVGDVVVLYGIMDNYKGTVQMKNAWIMQVETTVFGNVEAPKTPVETTIAEALTMKDGDLVIFTGTVSSFKDEWSTQYNNCTPYISDGNGNTIYVFRCTTKVNVGDVVKVTGEIDVYEGKYSINTGSTVEVITPATPDQGGEEGGETPEGAISASKTIAEIATANSWADAQKYSSFALDSVITVSSSGTDANTGKYYTSGNDWRLYQTGSPTLTISATEGYEIVSVKVTYSQKNTGCLTLTGSNVASGTLVDVNAQSVTFSVGNTGDATNGQARVTSIEVVYRPVQA
ncbi:MAG: hypothetical protein IKC54_04530, partial [Clostridia bacterium]|nr:hypothetical protein [Clostridia bacterium]